MLGSHNSFTYLMSQFFPFELIFKLWRCQFRTIQVQYEMGVRYFDVRLMKDTSIIKTIKRLFKKDTEEHVWACGHGIAEVDQKFNTVEDVCKYFSNLGQGDAKYRIILEKGNSTEIESFKEEIKGLAEKYPNLLFLCVKLPWEILYMSPKHPTDIKDYCCRLFNWDVTKGIKYNLKNFKISYTLYRWARLNNPTKITDEMIRDPKTLYFMDYIGTYPTMGRGYREETIEF